MKPEKGGIILMITLLIHIPLIEVISTYLKE